MLYLFSTQIQVSIGIRKIILALILFANFPATSQILEHYDPLLWVNQKTDSAVIQSNPNYVGNYRVLDFRSQKALKTLRAITANNSGTLFFVVRPKSDSVITEPLLRLGSITLYQDSLLMDGYSAQIPSIKQPAIIKVKYQGRAGRKWRSRRVKLSDAVELAEVIYYKELLNDKDTRIVESLLAMKYSINITENEDEDKKYYMNIYKEKVWDFPADGLYNEEVLALGRMDRIDFFQTQTMSADSKSIQMSLDSMCAIGKMPQIGIGDTSLLIVSKRKLSGHSGPCGYSNLMHPWKLNLFNWHSTAQVLHLTIDTLLGSVYNPVITNGQYSFPLAVVANGPKTFIKIPLANLKNNEDYFLRWSLVPDSCDPVADISVMDCAADSLQNSVNIDIQHVALPAALSMVNLSNGKSLEEEIQNTQSTIENLDGGQYHLHISNAYGLVKDTVFLLQSCQLPQMMTGQTASGDLATSTSKTENEWVFKNPETENNNSTGQGSALSKDTGEDGLSSKGITVYPNPGKEHQDISFQFSGLKGGEFTIQIYDDKGSLHDQVDFTPGEDFQKISYQFTHRGIYLIRFISEDYTAIKQVIISTK